MAISIDSGLQGEIQGAVGDLFEGGTLTIKDGSTTLATYTVQAGDFSASGVLTATGITGVAEGDPDSFDLESAAGNTLSGSAGGPTSGADLVVTNNDDPGASFDAGRIYINSDITISAFNIQASAA